MSAAGYRRAFADLTAGRISEQSADLPLFNGKVSEPTAAHTKARLHDPGTSHAAAAAAVESARIQRETILACLRQYGPQTADELDARLHWRDTTAGRRMRELWQAGAVVSTGEERPTRSGRAAEVWEALP